MNSNEEIENALKKRALGYESNEVTEEYVTLDDGAVKLVKRKVVSKSVPPDISAVKILMELTKFNDNLSTLSDDELEREKQRLLKLLAEEENESNRIN